MQCLALLLTLSMKSKHLTHGESRKSLSSFENASEKMSRTLSLRQSLPLLLLARILRWLSSCVTVAYMLAHFKFLLPLPPPSFPNLHHSCNLLTATTRSSSHKPNPSSAHCFQSWSLVIQLDTKIVHMVALFIDSILVLILSMGVCTLADLEIRVPFTTKNDSKGGDSRTFLL